MKNMRLDITASSKANGCFDLTAYLLGVNWGVPDAVSLPSALLQLHDNQKNIHLFSKQLRFRLKPFITMMFKKFYYHELPPL